MRDTPSACGGVVHYEKLGFSVIPIKPGPEKKPLIKWKPYQEQRATPDEIRAWWAKWPNANIGVITGAISNIIVVDIDGPVGLEGFRATFGDIPATISQGTGRDGGGLHLLFKHPGGDRYPNTESVLCQKVDSRGDGGYIVAAPSIHHTGRAYKWNIDPVEMGLEDLLDLPDDLKALLVTNSGSPPANPKSQEHEAGKKYDPDKLKKARKVLAHCCETIRGSQEGEQHRTRRNEARLIGGYIHQYIDENEVLSVLEQAVRDSGAQDMRAAMKTVRDGLEYGKLQAEPLDDLLDFEIKEKPHLDITKFSGITKAFIELATRNSEAARAAVMGTFLARFGVEVGRNPFFMVGDTVHHGRLDCVVVGDSSKSRKGTSEKPVNSLFSLPDSEKQGYKPARTSPGPFSSGEGVIYKVRDQVESWNTKEQKTEITDPGVTDKRLFICDEEFNNVLANVKREGNTLSMVIRKAWDDGTFEPLTKNSRMSATNAHVGWVCHITGYELQAKLPECEGFNGFANRILWFFAQRQKLVPLPEPMPAKELAELQYLLLSILTKCHECEREISFTQEAKKAWVNKYYQKLSSQNGNGLLGVVLSRGEAQVRRLALLFTLLDGEHETALKHLDQAMAVWQYCEDSACYIFKGQAQDSVARKITKALQEKGSLTSTEISNLFARHLKKERIENAIEEILSSGTAELISKQSPGRPFKVLKLKHTSELSELSEIRSDDRTDKGLNSHNSLNSLRDSEKNDGLGCSDFPDEM